MLHNKVINDLYKSLRIFRVVKYSWPWWASFRLPNQINIELFFTECVNIWIECLFLRNSTECRIGSALYLNKLWMSNPRPAGQLQPSTLYHVAHGHIFKCTANIYNAIKITQLFRRLLMPLIVIFTHAACKPAHINSCQNRLDAHALTVLNIMWLGVSCKPQRKCDSDRD